MATLRLFANLRELAGLSRLEVEGDTVGEVIEEAVSRFGPEFAAGLGSAAMWRNGEPASASDPIGAGDELALIPPVSGGGDVMVGEMVDASLVTGLLGLLILIGTNLAPGPAWWAAGLVLLAALWATDLASRLTDRDRAPATIGILASFVIAAVATHVLGGIGFGLTPFLAVAVVMGWGVAVPEYRRLEVVAPSVVIALVGSAAVGSLMLTRTFFEDEHHAISILIVVAALSAVTAVVLSRLRTPMLDPYSGVALAAVVGAVVGSLIWREDIVGYILIGLGLAVGLVAGRSLGSIIRTGRLALSETPPGPMTTLDPLLFAAALYYPLVSIVL
ncbi:MAG: MoaD/ThiS family protein [Acidimicrobiia bacterium]